MLRLKVIFGISLIVNLFFVSSIMIYVYQKGGADYVFKLITYNNDYQSGAQARREQHEILPLNKNSIVFVGDSLTDQGEWTELLANPNVKNRGIGFDTTAGILQRIPAIAEAKPQKIFIMAGVNDLGTGKDVQTTAGRYRMILSAIKEKSPGTKVYVQSTLPVNEDLTIKNVKNEDIILLNQRLQQAAVEYNATYIDLFPEFVSGDQLNPAYTFDGVHLNGAGYAVWRDALKLFL